MRFSSCRRMYHPAMVWLLLASGFGTPVAGHAGTTPAAPDYSAQPIGGWLDDLRDPAPRLHNRAVQAVSHIRPVAAETVPALTELLRSEDWKLRHRGLMVLGNLGADAAAALPSILPLLSDESSHVRRMAASSLRRIPAQTREVRLGIVAALQHEDYVVRRDAAYTLESQGETAADVAPELAALIETEDDKVRYAVFRILAQVGPDAAVPLLIPYLHHEKRDIRGGAAGVIGKFGADAGPALPTLRAMLGESQRGRLAARTLASIGPAAQSAVPELTALLHASDPGYSIGPLAAEALGAIGPGARDALPALRGALSHTNDTEASGRYRAALVKAIDRIAGPGDWAVVAYARRMSKGISSWNPMTRVEAARALVGLGPSALPALAALREALLEDPEVKIRGLAAEALGGMGPGAEPSLPDLRRATEDPDPHVRKKATRAIEQIEKSLTAKAPPSTPEPAPPAAIAEPDPERALAGPTLAEDVAAFSTGGRRASVRLLERGPEALPALHELLLASDTDAQVRGRAISLLAEIGDPSSVGPVLASLRAHPDEPLMAVPALRALSEMPPAPATFEFAAGILENPDARPRLRRGALIALAKHRDSRARVWAERFRNHEDVQTRIAALYLAARLGDTTAADPVTELLRTDASPSNRYALLLALAEIVDPGEFETRAGPARSHGKEYASALRIARYRSGSPPERSALFSEMLGSSFPNEKKLAIRGLLERDALDELTPLLDRWWIVSPEVRFLVRNGLRLGGYRIVEEKRRVAIAPIPRD